MELSIYSFELAAVGIRGGNKMECPVLGNLIDKIRVTCTGNDGNASLAPTSMSTSPTSFLAGFNPPCISPLFILSHARTLTRMFNH